MLALQLMTFTKMESTVLTVALLFLTQFLLLLARPVTLLLDFSKDLLNVYFVLEFSSQLEQLTSTAVLVTLTMFGTHFPTNVNATTLMVSWEGLLVFAWIVRLFLMLL